MLAGFPPVRGPLRLLAAHGLRGTLEWARLLLMPAEALGQRLFASDAARAWLYGSARHGDVPPLSGLPSDTVVSGLESAVLEHAGASLGDDLCIVAARVRAA
jgi:hypothetical protein